MKDAANSFGRVDALVALANGIIPPDERDGGSILGALESRKLLAANISVTTRVLRFNDPRGGDESLAQRITIRNTGDRTLTLAEGKGAKPQE